MKARAIVRPRLAGDGVRIVWKKGTGIAGG